MIRDSLCHHGREIACLECIAEAAHEEREAAEPKRLPSAWSEWGDGHDYSRSNKHDPNECRQCLRHVIKRLEARPFADRMVEAEARVATLVSIAKRATNGWACYAKRQIEHDEIARLHREIDALLSALPAQGESASAGSADTKD